MLCARGENYNMLNDRVFELLKRNEQTNDWRVCEIPIFTLILNDLEREIY